MKRMFSISSATIILQVAGKGDVDEFQRLYNADPNRLNIQDARGVSPAHKAAENDQLKILEFIYTNGGGKCP